MGNSVYDIVYERIVQKLEEGVVPWQKPWAGCKPPASLVRKTPYRGINVVLLAMSGQSSPWWLTYKDCRQRLGGRIKDGQYNKWSMVVFWKPRLKVNGKWLNDKQFAAFNRSSIGDNDEVESVPLLRYYRVWNLSQCEGIPEDKIPEEVGKDGEPLDLCEEIVDGMPCPPAIKLSDVGRAFYRGGMFDEVSLPRPRYFENKEAYYVTLFHELAHATGHEKRLARKKAAADSRLVGSYSQEELVAEMTACFLCSEVGIESTFDNSAAYISGWLESFDGDRKMLVFAGHAAQKAADWIMNRIPDEKVLDLIGGKSAGVTGKACYTEDVDRAAFANVN